MKTSFKKVAIRTAACAAVVGAVASTMSLSANADPKQYAAAVGLGSDTTQDVLNALSGHANGRNYTPVQSSAATGLRQLISFDATNPSGTDPCITTKLNGPSFDRPNGSSAGRRALSRATDGTGFGTAACGGPVDISGFVDFARSSSGPSSGDTGTDLTYIPFGQDAISFAYYRADGNPVTTLTRAQLTSLFTGTGAQTINGVRILPCGIQDGSGTYEFWNRTTTATVAQEATATSECNAFLGRAQENDAVDLKARGDAADAAVNGTQVVIGFSAGAFIAKSNGVATPTPPSGVGIGSISNDGAGNNLGSPVSGTAPNLVPVAGFYNNPTFGRQVYNVFATATIDSFLGNNDLKSMFKGSGATLCQQTATINTFGFLVAPNCGDSSLKGSFRSGQNP